VFFCSYSVAGTQFSSSRSTKSRAAVKPFEVSAVSSDKHLVQSELQNVGDLKYASDPTSLLPVELSPDRYNCFIDAFAMSIVEAVTFEPRDLTYNGEMPQDSTQDALQVFAYSLEWEDRYPALHLPGFPHEHNM